MASAQLKLETGPMRRGFADRRVVSRITTSVRGWLASLNDSASRCAMSKRGSNVTTRADVLALGEFKMRYELWRLHRQSLSKEKHDDNGEGASCHSSNDGKARRNRTVQDERHNEEMEYDHRRRGVHEFAICARSATMDEYVGNEWPGYAKPMPRHGTRWITSCRRSAGRCR